MITSLLLAIVPIACDSSPSATVREPTPDELEQYAPDPLSDKERELLKEMVVKQRDSDKPTVSYNELSDDPAPRERVFEQVPSELSVAHFGSMELIGKNFVIEDTLKEEDAYVRHAVSYLSNGLKITGILNIPKGNGPFPLVILNHGYIDPAVYTTGRGLKREQDFLARNGYAVMHTDYRGHAGSDPSPDTRNAYDAGLEYSMDSVNVIHAIENADMPKIDTSRVGMLGHSMGGGVSLNIAVAHPELVDAFVLYAPVSGDAWRNYDRWEDMRDENDRTRDVLGTANSNPHAWLKLSSATRLSEVRSPILIVHGSEDADVPVEWSRELADALEGVRKKATYLELEGEKHEFIAQWDTFMAETVAFLDRHLK